MRVKIILILITIVLICVGIYYKVNQETVHEVIDQSIEERTETMPAHHDKNEDEQIESNSADEQNHEEQATERITNVFKNTVDLIFRKDFKIVAVGDSLTQGIGDETKNGGYVGILNDTINHNHEMITFENFGKRGHRTDQLLKRLEEPEIVSAVKDADIVLMTIGANDIMQVVKENFADLTYPLFVEEQVSYEARLNHIFEKIENINPAIQIYHIGLYNPFEQYFKEIEELDLIVDSWNQTSVDTSEKYEEATFIPVKDLFDETDINLFAEDNFHPNLNGYQRIAKRVLTYLADTAER